MVLSKERQKNIDVIQENIELFKSDIILKQVVANQVRRQEYILENGIKYDWDSFEKHKTTKVEVTKEKSTEAAMRGEGRVAFLNFASATTPGGGVLKGSTAQEEGICRTSSLYASISIKEAYEKFYNPHIKAKDVLHNDDIIYTPKVCIFRNEYFSMLPKANWKLADVITCAAPNLRAVPANGNNLDESGKAKIISNEELATIHKKRAVRIFESAAAHKVNTLILGAFGCGAFWNDPETVAKAYKEVIDTCGYLFDNIIFPVYCKNSDNPNYEIFKKVIGNKEIKWAEKAD